MKKKKNETKLLYNFFVISYIMKYLSNEYLNKPSNNFEKNLLYKMT